MTDQSVGGAHVPLGVGQIVGESFSLLFKRLGVFFLLTFVPTLISIGISVSYFGVGFYTGNADPTALFASMTSPIGIIVMMVVPMISP